MCLIAFTLGQNPHFPLVLAANRDEVFNRPTRAMDWWRTDDGTRILAGKDLRSNGTWLAITEDGRISAVTNVREGMTDTAERSRGELPLRALVDAAARVCVPVAIIPATFCVQLNQVEAGVLAGVVVQALEQLVPGFDQGAQG